MMSNDTLESLLAREDRWLRKNKQKSKDEDRELRYHVTRAESLVKELETAAMSSQSVELVDREQPKA